MTNVNKATGGAGGSAGGTVNKRLTYTARRDCVTSDHKPVVLDNLRCAIYESYDYDKFLDGGAAGGARKNLALGLDIDVEGYINGENDEDDIALIGLDDATPPVIKADQ